MTGGSQKRSRGPGLVTRFLLLAGSLLISLLLAELLLRIVPLPGDGYRPTLVREVGRSKRPGPDFRDRAHPQEKADGVFRILAIGDSITWGAGMHSQDAYPDRLGRTLQRLPSTQPIEVLNLSRPGWNTEQEWKHSHALMKTIAPDLMIVGFCLNDVEMGPKARNQLLAPAQRRTPRGRMPKWLIARSVLAKTMYGRAENIRRRRAVRAYYQAIYEEPNGWSGCVKSLESFRSYAVHSRIPLLVVIFPIFDGQIDADYPYRNLHQKIRDAGAEIGITVLDLLPTFEGIDARRLAIEPFTDAHPNELAHRIAADTILDLLIRRNWLPLRPDAAEAAVNKAAPPVVGEAQVSTIE